MFLILNLRLLAIAVGLVVMMWPILTKVQYERLPQVFSSSRLWIHLGISFVLNWIIGPFMMLALAWATLPDLPGYRTGVVLVGIARCIAMVMIWNQLARGDGDYCAILVVFNAVLQIVLFSPFALLFINVIGGQDTAHVSYRDAAISVLIVSPFSFLSAMILSFVPSSTLESHLSRALLPVTAFGRSQVKNSSTKNSSHSFRPLRFSAYFTRSSSCLLIKDITLFTTYALFSASSSR